MSASLGRWWVGPFRLLTLLVVDFDFGFECVVNGKASISICDEISSQYRGMARYEMTDVEASCCRRAAAASSLWPMV